MARVKPLSVDRSAPETHPTRNLPVAVCSSGRRRRTVRREISRTEPIFLSNFNSCSLGFVLPWVVFGGPQIAAEGGSRERNAHQQLACRRQACPNRAKGGPVAPEARIGAKAGLSRRSRRTAKAEKKGRQARCCQIAKSHAHSEKDHPPAHVPPVRGLRPGLPGRSFTREKHSVSPSRL